MAANDIRSAPTDGTGARTVSSAAGILALLFAANLLNFYDRAIPAIVVEPLKAEFSLSDADIGLLSASFTIVYAIFGIPLGRLADRTSRRTVLVVGLVAWSVLTAATGVAGSFVLLVVIRLLIGVGEASFAPAANSVLADLYPAQRRARPTGLVQLGLPVGLVLAFFTVGAITEAYGTWRAAFFIAAVPGLLVAALLAFIREPVRGGSDALTTTAGGVEHAIRRVLRIRTIWWLALAGIGSQVASYAVATFSVPLFQRYFGTSLTAGGMLTGVTIGLTGLVGLLAGGRIADRASRRSPASRVYTGAVALLLATPLTLGAFLLDADMVGLFIVLFSAGWLLQYLFITAAYPAIADVVGPHLRGTAIAVYLATSYLLGGAFGPVVAGALSDHFTSTATGMAADEASAHGLHRSLLIVIPAGLLLTAIGLLGAARHVTRDSAPAN